uniref:Uncharacterized protein n=1 Tax=Arundo donax TaxID=35708 RepID=A0A0A9FKJ0_ARUDO
MHEASDPVSLDDAMAGDRQEMSGRSTFQEHVIRHATHEMSGRSTFQEHVIRHATHGNQKLQSFFESSFVGKGISSKLRARRVVVR